MAANAEVMALAVSGVALWISILAFRSAHFARLQALRTEVRREIDNALAEAKGLRDRAITLTEDTMRTASQVRADETVSLRPDEREAFSLRQDAEQPLVELSDFGTDLSRKSRKQLEAVLREAARIRRSIDDLGTKIDVKNAALDRLLEKSQTTGNASDRPVVFRSVSQEPKAQRKDT